MRYHYIPYSKPAVAESILEENPVVRTWWGQPILTKRVYAMDGYRNMSEEENEIADMTPAQYKKWAMEIGEKPRKGFQSELIYNKVEGLIYAPAKSENNTNTKNQNKMNIDKSNLLISALVGTGAGLIANALGWKNPLGWGILGGTGYLAGTTLMANSASKSAPPVTVSTPPEDRLNAVGYQATKQDRAGVGRTFRVKNIGDVTGDKTVNVMNDQFSLLGAGLFSKKPSSAKGSGTGGCCSGYWNGDQCIGTLVPCGSKPVALRV